MPKKKDYPSLKLYNKEGLAKRISGDSFPPERALALIDRVINNFDSYWHDSPESTPDKGKFVRSAVGNELGKLLKLIDAKVLKPHDHQVPKFMFGGLSKKNHLQAAKYLLGKDRNRTLIKLDIATFFEQMKRERIFSLFRYKFGCSQEVAQILSFLCCVPSGKKGSGSTNFVLARGFATSSRLAVWCNLTTFARLEQLVKGKLKNYDPRVAIFVDDIGITASRVNKELMEKFADEVIEMLAKSDPKQPLPINIEKKHILSYEEGLEHLGLKLGRNKISMGSKSWSRMINLKRLLKKMVPGIEKQKVLQKYKSYLVYLGTIKKINRETQESNK